MTKLYDGELFITFKCEMSLHNFEDLARFVLMELEIDESRLRVGRTHNSYSGAYVFSDLVLDDVVSFCVLSYIYNNWHLVIIPQMVFKKDSLFSGLLVTGYAKKKMYDRFNNPNLNKVVSGILTQTIGTTIQDLRMKSF